MLNNHTVITAYKGNSDGIIAVKLKNNDCDALVGIVVNYLNVIKWTLIKKSNFSAYSTSPVRYAFKLIHMCFWRSLVIVIGDAQTSNKKTLIKLLMQVISVYQSTKTTVMFYLYIHTVFMHILHAYLLKNINNVIWYHGSLV